MEPEITGATKVFKALSDSKRLSILQLLAKQELCGNEILEVLDITQPTLSHNMKILHEVGMIHRKRSGKNVYYRLNRESFDDILRNMETLINK